MNPWVQSTTLNWAVHETKGGDSRFRRELCEIVNSEHLFNTRHFLNVFFKSIVAKQLLFLLLEIITKRRVFVLADDGMQCWKQHRVFARFMGIVHSNELL